MAKVPITVMGYQCERCFHEWVPRDFDAEPRVCPKCKSPYWNRPRKTSMSYEEFACKIVAILKGADRSLTWTEIRTQASLPQKFPNNQWVRRMEQDSGLHRHRDAHWVIHWQLVDVSNPKTAKAAEQTRPRPSRKSSAME